MNKKPTNPKDAIGSLKVAPHHVPQHIEAKLSLAMLEGAIKYGSYNYRVAGVRASIYYDAFKRHMAAWWEGQDIDPDSGLPHLWKALACIAIIEDAKTNGLLADDRPPKLLNQQWVQELNVMAEGLITKLPPAVEPYTEKTYRQTELFKEINPPAMNAYEMWQRIKEQSSEDFYPEQNKFKEVNPTKSETVSYDQFVSETERKLNVFID